MHRGSGYSSRSSETACAAPAAEQICVMRVAQLHVGGLVAVGIDSSASYLLTVSHAGRGVFDTRTWERVARDLELAYPVDSQAIGIGPLAGQKLAVKEIDYDTSSLTDAKLGDAFVVSYEGGVVTVNSLAHNERCHGPARQNGCCHFGA